MVVGGSIKTPEQIRAWLKSREWFPQFMRNTIDYDYRTAEVLSGDRGQDTVLDAFYWVYAPEGLNFWSEKNQEFREWYFSENAND